MEDFERQLQEALRRKYAPPYLESRILAVAAAESAAPRTSLFGGMRLRWAAALGAVVLTFGGIAWERDRQQTIAREQAERAAGQAAKERLQLALKITSVKLQQIHRDVVDNND